MSVDRRKCFVGAALALALLLAIFVHKSRREPLSITFQGVETNRTGEVEHIFVLQNHLADIEISPFILTAGGEEFGIGKRAEIFQQQKDFKAGRYELRGDDVSYHRVRYFTHWDGKIDTGGVAKIKLGQRVILRCSQPIQPVSWVAGIWYTEPATPHRDRLAIWNNWLSTKFGVPSLVQNKAMGGQLMSEIIAWRPLLPWAPAVASMDALERTSLTNK